MRKDARRTKGISLAKGPATLIGLALLALGITGLLFASTSFTASPVDGDVQGETWLTIAGNGWTWALFGAAGLLLLLAAPMHWGAKSMALIVGLALGAASVIAIADGADVLGIFAANGMTMLVWGVAAAALLLIALLPRVGRKERVDADARDRHGERERVVEREPARPREHHEPRAHAAPTVPAERAPVDDTRGARAESGPVERTGRFERGAETTDRHGEPSAATTGHGREDVPPEEHDRTRRQ